MTLVIFDLDDTLLNTSDLFWKVREEFLSMLKARNLSLVEMRQMFEEQDTINIKRFGFSSDRYGKTMISVLDLLIKANEISDSQELRSRAKKIGQKISYEVPELIENSKIVLDSLIKSNNYRLVLITRGSEDVQLNKLKVTGLQNYFKEFTKVVEVKNAYVFLEVITKMNSVPNETWIIGDSIKSDINPGLSIGANCIHFKYKHEHYNWIQEHDENPISDDFYEITDLREILAILNNVKPEKSRRKRRRVYA